MSAFVQIGQRLSSRFIDCFSQPTEMRQKETVRHVASWILSHANAVLDDISADFLEKLLETGTLQTIETSSLVFAENDKDRRAFIVLHGQLSAFSKSKKSEGSDKLYNIGRQENKKEDNLVKRIINTRHRRENEGARLQAEAQRCLYRTYSDPGDLCSDIRNVDLRPASAGVPSRIPDSTLPALLSPTAKMISCSLETLYDMPDRRESRDNSRQTFGDFLYNIRTGHMFGENALFNTRAARKMTVIADVQTYLIEIQANDFQSAAQQFKQEDLHEKTEFLEALDLFQDWDWSLKFHLAHSMEWKRYPMDGYVVREGELASNVHFVVSGQLVLLATASNNVTTTSSLAARRLPTKLRKVRQLAHLPPTAMFGLGEMLCKMTTYRLSVRATEQTTVLQIQSQKLRSVIEKYHPKTLKIISDIIQQQERFRDTHLYESVTYDDSGRSLYVPRFRGSQLIANELQASCAQSLSNTINSKRGEGNRRIADSHSTVAHIVPHASYVERTRRLFRVRNVALSLPASAPSSPNERKRVLRQSESSPVLRRVNFLPLEVRRSLPDIFGAVALKKGDSYSYGDDFHSFSRKQSSSRAVALPDVESLRICEKGNFLLDNQK